MPINPLVIRKHAIEFLSDKFAFALGLARPKICLFKKLSECARLGSASARERSTAVCRWSKLTAGSRKDRFLDTLPAWPARQFSL